MRRCAGVEIDAARAKYATSQGGIKEAELVPADTNSYPPLVWIDGILSREESFDYLPYQRCSKVPGMDYMCYKSSLFTALNEMCKYYPHKFSVYPKTLMLPNEFLEFQREHMQICSRSTTPPTWVVKPRNSCCGAGITIIQSVHEASQVTEQSVIQQYVKPYLVNDRKFDFRFYVLIASMCPLRLFIYKEGIARFCSEPFQMPSRANREDNFIHLTNTAINVKNGDASPEDFTKKATDVLRSICQANPEGKNIWPRVKHCARAVIIGILPKLISLLPKQREQRLIPLYLQRARQDYRQRKREEMKGDENKKEDERPSQCLVEEKEKEQIEESALPPLNKSRKLNNSPTSKPQPKQESHSQLPTLSEFSSRRRSLSQSPHRKPQPVPTEQKQEQPTKEVSEEEHPQETIHQSQDFLHPQPETTENKEPKKGRGLPPLKPVARYFHILGIDVILDSDLHPKILELNDRPSLSVTVDFEKDLKTGFIRDCFEHVTTTGESNGESDKSGWEQIYPILPGDIDDPATWDEIVRKATHPKPNGEIDAVPVQQPRQPLVGLGSTQPKKKKKGKKGKSGKKSKQK